MVEAPVTIPAMQHETLHGFHTIQGILDVQDANELLNIMFNIVWQQNSNSNEERLQHLEEILPNSLSRENIIQEVVSRKTHAAIPYHPGRRDLRLPVKGAVQNYETSDSTSES